MQATYAASAPIAQRHTAAYLPLNKIHYLDPRMDRIMKIPTAIIVSGLAGVA